VTALAAATGEVVVRIALGDHARGMWVARDGTAAVVQVAKELRWYDLASGDLRRSLPIRTLAHAALVSHDECAVAVVANLFEYDSDARVHDLATGKLVYRTPRPFGVRAGVAAHGAVWIAGDGGVVRLARELTGIHAKPATHLARLAGDVAIASAGKILVAGRPIARTRGEVRAFVPSPDGDWLLAIDEAQAQVVAASGVVTARATRDRIERATGEEPCDRGFFGAANVAHVVDDDGRAYRLSDLAPAGIAPTEPPPRVEVDADHVVLRDPGGAIAARIHVAPDGKSALVVEEGDGARFEWLGRPRATEHDGAALVHHPGLLVELLG
jgi:hypothetical protein